MKNETRSLRVSFSLIEALFFAIFATSSFMTTYLMELGLTSSQVGSITSVAALVGMIFLPMWGVLSDKLGSAKFSLLGTMAFTVILFALLPILSNKVPTGAVVFYFVYISVIYLFKQPTNSLLDGWAVSSLSPVGLSYSVVRKWGSIGYAIMSFLLSFLLKNWIKTADAFVLMPVLYIPFAVIVLKQKNSTVPVKEKNDVKAQGAFRKVLGNKDARIFLICSIGLHMYLSVTLIFMAYNLEHAGCSSSDLGLVTGFRAIVEIAGMYGVGYFGKKLTQQKLLIISGLLFGIEHMLYMFVSGIVPFMGLMVLSGLAGGIFYSVGPAYLSSVVDSDVQNTAQSLSGFVMAGTLIIGTFVGGKIIGSLGISYLTTGCGIIILALTTLFSVHSLKNSK